jgi:hypothetical protein
VNEGIEKAKEIAFGSYGNDVAQLAKPRDSHVG